MIHTFPQEIEDGLSDIIQANTTLAWSVDISKTLDNFIQADANSSQPDLFYLESILVSTGWNANDEVFDKNELIKAKDTPVDKQFNYMHNETDIIGHITSTKIIAESKVITDLSSVPDDFDISVGSVLYRTWRDKELQERMDRIIAEIKENKWFISMECLFDNFDYAVITPTGDKRIIARNAETCFLTKHLRAYKGTGQYQGHKVGRIPRNIIFCGKGLVDNPANKRSVIYHYSDFSDVEYVFTAAEQKMSLTYTKEQYDEVNGKLAETAASLKEAQSQVKVLEANNKNLTDKVTDLSAKVDASVEIMKNKETSLASLQASNDELNKKLADLDSQVKAFAVEKLKASRLSKLSNSEVTQERAIALVEKFISVADELFDEVVNSLPKKPTKDQKKIVAFDDIKIEPKVEPTLSVASDDNSELRSSVANWVASTFQKKTKN